MTLPPGRAPIPEHELSELVVEVWRRRFGEVADTIDARLRAVSSLDLLDLEIDLRRATGRLVRIDSIDGPITLDAVTREVRVAALDPGPSSDASSADGESPATHALAEQWLHERMHPSSRAYLISLVVPLDPGTTRRAVSRAMTALVATHPMLRTAIVERGGAEGPLQQRIDPPPSMVLVEPRAVIEIDDDSIRTIVDGLGSAVPSISSGRPFRAFGLERNGSLAGLLLLVHHGVVDDPSLRILVEDLRSSLRDDSLAPELVSIQTVGRREIEDGIVPEELGWWRRRLEPCALGLRLTPTGDDESKPLRRVVHLDVDAVQRMDTRLRESGGVRAAGIVQAVRTTIDRIGLSSDDLIAIGMPMSLRGGADLERTVGMRLNTVPVPVGAQASVSEIADEIRACRRRRAVPYDAIAAPVLRGNPSRAPWLDVVVGVVENDRDDRAMHDYAIGPPIDASFPLLVIGRFTPAGCDVEIVADPRFVAPEMFERFSRGIREHLVRLAAGVDDDLSIVSGPVRSSSAPNLVEIVRAGAIEFGDRAAIEGVDGSSLTYRQLDAWSDALAWRLSPNGAGLDESIAILAEPGIEFCVAVVAAMKVGGAAMPLSPDLPAGRVEQLLAAAGTSHAIVDSTWNTDRGKGVIERLGVRSIAIADGSGRSNEATPWRLDLDPDRACYVLFTSGSTGVPKAVRMPHRGLLGLVEHEKNRIGTDGSGRTAQYAPLGFDVMFQELFATWSTGGVVIPLTRDVRRDPAALSSEIERREIVRIHLPPLMLRAIASVSPGGFPACLREIVCAGERLRIDETVRKAARKSPDGVDLLNQYGPTETHVVTSLDLGNDPDRWPDFPSIGSALPGVELRVVDAAGQSVPMGGQGELVVLGDAVALGYVGDVQGGFEPFDGRSAYRTGDRARIGTDGDVEFMGRADDQVKISGYRVEPAEVEAALVQVDGVQEATVVAIDVEDATRLAAFVVSDDPSAVVGRCLDLGRRVLPPWMTPAAIWAIDRIPRSSNGKVDRTALIEEAKRRGVRDGPAQLSVSIDRILELVGSDECEEDFTDRPLGTLGLDSLGAIRLQIALRDRYGIEHAVAQLLMTTLEELRRTGSTTVEDLESERSLVAGQENPSGVWRPLDPLVRDVLAEDALSERGAFHLAWQIDLDQEVSIETLRGRLARICERFPTLRTCRRADQGELVLEPDEALPKLDQFEREPEEDEIAWLLRHRLAVAEGSPWRVATWPSIGGGRSVLVVMHHVAVDGRTAMAILDEIAGVPRESMRVASGAMGSEEETTHNQWWIERVRASLGDQGLEFIEDVREESLEISHSMPATRVFTRSVGIAATLGMPPIAPSLVAWGILLARTTGRRRAIVGVPFATDVDDAGLGTSILPVVVDATDDRRIHDVVSEVARTIADGLEHRHASLGRIVRALEPETSFLRPPLDGVLTRDEADRRVPGARIRWRSTGSSVFRAGLMLPNGESDSPAVLEIERSRLQGEASDAFLERFSVILAKVCDQLDSKSAVVGDIDDRSIDSIRTATAFGSSEASCDRRSLQDRFDDVVGERPDATAIEDADGAISYVDLQAWSTRLAGSMIERLGPLTGRSVVVVGSRSASIVASMLAVSRAGGAFVPIEMELPPDVRRKQLSQAHPVAIIGHEADLGDLVEKLPVFDPMASRTGPIPALEEMPARSNEDALYIMFTSGTTGEPRGTVVPDRAVLRLADDPWFLPAGPGFRMLHAAPLAFDASTLEIWWPLLNGGTICCWERSAAELPALRDRMEQLGVRGCWLTAALFHAAVDGLPEFFDGLDVVLTGGDVVSADHVARLLVRRPGLAVVNGYGPTENTVFTACEPLVHGGVPARSALPIGRPIRGTEVRILDPDGRDTPLGRFGELVATGDGVALGYLDGDGRPERREGFDLDPDSGVPRYRTGDRVRWRADGRLEFGGRLDAQVKVAGRRIELSAIDATLREEPDIVDACSAVWAEDGRSRLVGLVVLEAGSSVDTERVRTRLATRIPSWEVPAVLVSVSDIPRTRNGKPDRRAVVNRCRGERGVVSSVDHETGSAASNRELLGVVCRCIETVTGRPVVAEDALLLESGVDSLDLLRLALELEANVARPVHLTDVLEGGTPRAIAERIASDIRREDANVVALQPGASRASRSLYCVPGVGGTVFSFETILPGLPSWLPVYGLPFPGTAGSEKPMRRVEALGEAFASRIRETAPVSVIAGYSLGGFVAFETARRLAEFGPPPRVVVIDSTPAALPRRHSMASRLASGRAWKMRLRNVLPQSVADRLGGRGGRSLESLRTVVAAGFEALRAYNPSPAPVEVTLVRSAQTDFQAFGGIQDLGWNELAERVQVVEIQSTHLEVFRGGSMELSRAIRDVVRSTRHLSS